MLVIRYGMIGLSGDHPLVKLSKLHGLVQLPWIYAVLAGLSLSIHCLITIRFAFHAYSERSSAILDILYDFVQNCVET